MWSGPDEGPIAVVSVIITGSIAAGLCFTGIFVARRVFRWGNRRRRHAYSAADARSAAWRAAQAVRRRLCCCFGGGSASGGGGSGGAGGAMLPITPGETLRRKA